MWLASTTDGTGGVFDSARGFLETMVIPASALLVVCGVLFWIGARYLMAAMYGRAPEGTGETWQETRDRQMRDDGAPF